MKYLIITLILLILNLQNIQAQQIMVETGKSVTSFKFNDVQSNALQNLQSTTQNYISFGYRQTIKKDAFYWIAGAGVNSYGAKGSDDNQNYFEWETTYIRIYGGADLNVIKFGNMAVSIRATISPEFIIQGTQTLNNQVYNLIGEEDFDKANLFFRGGALLDYDLTYTMSLFVQYKYGWSTQLKNPSLDSTQGNLRLQAHDIGFGLIITLDPKDTRKFRNSVKKANRTR